MLLLLVSLACRTKDNPIDTAPVDLDGDGFFGADDCDEENPDVYAGADELCDGVDSDCDGYDTARTSRCSDSDGFNPEHGLDPDFEPAETAQSDTRQKPKASTCMDDVE